jgi:hypothetical protein
MPDGFKKPAIFGKKRVLELLIAEYEADFCALQATDMAIRKKTGMLMSEKIR